MFEKLARVAGVAGLFLYAIGFVSVAFYLMSFGVLDLAPLRPQYVYTGFLALFSIGIPTLFFHVGVRLWYHRPEIRERAYQQVGRRIVAIVLQVPWPFLCVTVLEDRQGSMSTAMSFGSVYLDAAILVGYSVWVGEMALLSYLDSHGGVPSPFERFWKRRPFGASTNALLRGSDDGRRVLDVAFDVLVSGFHIIFILLLYLLIFSWTILPTVPVHLGGARPRTLSLIAAPDRTEYLESLGIRMMGPYSQQVEVLYEGTGFFILRLDDRYGTLRIDRSVLSGYEVMY